MSSSGFDIVDYGVFCAMLLISLSIGFYYALTGGRQRTAGEFLLGDRRMGVLPVSLSLLASFMSAVALLGIPSEIYTFGTQYTFMIFGYLMLIPIVNYIFLPVYYDLGITSIYEYLERRFNKIIRQLAASIFILQMCLYLAVVTYAPSLALSHVMGLNLWASVGIVIGVCTVYSTLGGIKAVMWTDVLQTIIMFVSVFVIMIKGYLDVGGIDEIWRVNAENKRIEFLNYSFDPRTRHTVWTQTIGALFTWLPIYGVNQAQVQRYLSTASLSVARKALWGNLLGLVWNAIVCNMIGLAIYARYHNCDPAKSKQIEQNDQLLPLFALETFSSVPGFIGLFVAGIISGSLSSLSSGLNSLAAVTLEDFIKESKWKNISEETAAIVLKGLALVYGIICLLCVALVALFPNISQAALGIFGLGGPLLGLFLLGMFFPWTNSLGAGVGFLFGLIQTVWLTVGVLVTKPPLPLLPVSVEGCNSSFSGFSNSSEIDNEKWNSTFSSLSSTSALKSFYSISYMWYGLLTALIVVITGLITSFITGPSKYDAIDSRLISPIVRKMKKSKTQPEKNGVQQDNDYHTRCSVELKAIDPH